MPRSLGAPKLVAERHRPAGYEETGGVSLDIPGVGVSVASFHLSRTTPGDAGRRVYHGGHTGFRMDAQIMSAILFHYLTDAGLRQAVATEHAALGGLYRSYQENLRKAYAVELTPKD